MIIRTRIKFKIALITGAIFFFLIPCIHYLHADTADNSGRLYYSAYIYIVIMVMLLLYVLLILILGNIIRKKNIELKTLKVKLDIADNKVRSLFMAIPDFLFILDDKYNFIDYKAEIEDELYADPADFIGKNINDVLPSYLAVLTAAKIDTVKQTGSMQKYNYELEVHGEKLSFNARVVRLTDDRYLLIARNVSEKKKREEEETKSHKLESIGFFAAGIAHDFNNILTAVVGYISLAMKKIDNKPKILELLNEAEKEVLGAKKLTEQLLVFTKGGVPVKEYADINDVVTQSADFIMSGSKTALNYNLAGEELKVNVDRNQISQVFQNIVLNASQAMNSAGTVNITVYKETLGIGNHLSLREGDYAVVEIRDAGAGIEKKNLKRIFDPYFTTRNDCNGLGLTICQNIINDHDGIIDVKSEPGEGSTFTVYLPLNNTSECDTAAEPVSSHLKSLKNKSIIIMDDEPQLRYIMQEVLRDEGAEIFLTSEGIEAIELFEKLAASGKPPDLIIADLTIPGGMGGMEAVRIIREQGVAFKAIVISGYSKDPVIADYHSYGFDAYLVKPFTSNDLLDAVKKIC